MLDDTSTAWINALTRGDTADAERLGKVLDTADTLDRQQRDHIDIHAAALDYGHRGIPVLPLHGISDGRCTCGRTRCSSPGKHPLTENGLLDATSDIDAINRWWTKWPIANIGIRTGILFDVVDIDGPAGVANMYNGTNPLIDDFTALAIARTGRAGGRHIYIAPTGRANGTALVPGVDFRGIGGYVVAPPSLSHNGRRYQWVVEIPDTITATTAA